MKRHVTVAAALLLSACQSYAPAPLSSSPGVLAGPDADGWRAQLRDEVEGAEIASYAESFNASRSRARDQLPDKVSDWPIEHVERLEDRVDAALDALIGAQLRETIVRDARASGSRSGR